VLTTILIAITVVSAAIVFGFLGRSASSPATEEVSGATIDTAPQSQEAR
jgi:hypothetical protein